MASAATNSKRSWRSPPRGGLVKRSRYVWRWLLSGLAIGLIAIAVYWAWPRPLPRTLLLTLSDEREERNILPPVPLVAGDVAALQAWAQAAKVTSLSLQLSKVEDENWLAERLTPSAGEGELRFPSSPTSGGNSIKSGDTLVIYIKGHGLALDVSSGDKPDVRPLLVKSLSESDLSTAWFADNRHVIDVRALLRQLAAIPGIRFLVIFDAVHVNYDPRLGTLVNAFPAAVRQAVDQLPARSNLWVLIGQGDGELAVDLSKSGRSAFVDALVTGLERKKNDPVGVSIDSLAQKTQSRLTELNQPGRGSFRQTLQALFPSAGGAIADRLTLPASPPPPPTADKAAGQKSMTTEVAKAVANTAPVQTATAPLQQAATAVGSATKSATKPATDAQGPTPQQVAGKEAASSTPSALPTAAPADGAVPPGAPPNDLELAWQSRDKLRDKFRTGWSPSHIGPPFWRRIESLLAGFDEQRLAGEQAPKDQETLRLLASDLASLESIFAGQGGSCATDDCRAIAESFAAFKAGPAFRSFQARQQSGLDTANEALKVFAETAYRARDYVYLHGQMAAILDGGPFVNDAGLDSLLEKLKTLGSRLDPSDLPDGRLTDARGRELARLQRDVDAARDQVEADIETYCRSVTAAAPACGKLLRVRLLLHSPAVTAKQRAALRKSSDTKDQATEPSGSSSEPSISARLAVNARLTKKWLAAVIPPAQASSPKAPATITTWMQLLDSAQASADPLAWARLGRGSREFAETFPATFTREVSGRSSNRSELTLLDTWRLSEAALLVDGRDARRWPDRSLVASWVAQPIRPELLPDKVELIVAPQAIQLHNPEQDAVTTSVAIRVQSEKPPPYTVSVDVNWNARDLDVTRGDGGAPLRSGRNDLVVESDKLELPLRIKSRRTTTDSPNATIRTQARFGNSQPVSTDLRCLLPRPDQIELTVSPDDNLTDAKRRIWFPSLPNGGRLNLFPNRERSVGFYLTNLSSEDKRLIARIYRVPPAAIALGGRLFDVKAGLSLLPAASTFDTRLSQPSTDIGQLLRGQLIAQTNEKEPFLLPAGSTPVKVPLAAIPPTPPTLTGNTPAAVADKNSDVTGGLLLVITSADGKSRPYFKWIELQMLQPDDLLAIKEPAYREGKLTFRVELKDRKLIDEMGLAKQPLKLSWETQALPPEVREPTKEALLTASDTQGTAFSAIVPAAVRWPLYVQLHVDGDPRGLVARLDRQNDSVLLTNLKENRPPEIHTWRVAASASRPAAPPERLQYLIRPPQPWLAFPAAATIAEGLPEIQRGQPVLIRIDPKAATARLDVSLGADVAARYFAEGARVHVTAENQPAEFATERQIAVRLAGIDSSLLQLQCDAADFGRIEFGPIDVPQDRRIELTAEITGDSTGVNASEFATSRTIFILDRTPPAIGQLQADRIPPRAAPVAGTPLQTDVVLRCRADDGEGSGIARVEFVVGFDQNKNGRLDDAERRPAIAGIKQSDGTYAAEFVITGEAPSDQLLVEASATDNVQQRSELAQTSLALPRQTQGGQRTTFGASKPGDDLGSKPQKTIPPAKK